MASSSLIPNRRTLGLRATKQKFIGPYSQRIACELIDVSGPLGTGPLRSHQAKRLLHRDLARLHGFCFWQRNGQYAIVDFRADSRHIDRWIKFVDAPGWPSV
jgi:hypothetical protein